MSAFDKVIGYETIKEELLQICDMIHNRKVYEDLGARLPQGVLLYGDPGLGKSLLANCLIEECGIPHYTVRRNRGEGFIRGITETFTKAKENAPAIIFLDDMDKFANESFELCDAEEYVAVQAGMEVIKNCDVFVIATANRIRKLPDSLLRAGRFDRKIEVKRPTGKDASEIIEYYLSGKKVSDSVNMEDLTKMFYYTSCAELETILNEAAISAAHKRKTDIEMDDLVKSVLRMQYASPDSFTNESAEELRKTALHEAGHLVVSEVLDPGSVGLASLRTTGRDSTGGFIHRCKELSRFEDHVMISLGGKAAVELYYSEACADGCHRDIFQAYNAIRNGLCAEGTNGFGMIDVSNDRFNTSESMNSRSEAVAQAELERYMLKTRDILIKNRSFLEAVTEALVRKETLLFSDIRLLRINANIIDVAV